MESSMDWNEALYLAGIFVLAAIVSLRWFRGYRKEKREFKEAEDCLNNGQYIDALRHLSKADENWEFNAAHSTPKTVLRDIDRLTAIVEMIGNVTDRLGAPIDTKELLLAIKDGRAIYSDKKHFKFGTFTLKNEFAFRSERLDKEIAEHRTRLRASYSHLLH